MNNPIYLYIVIALFIGYVLWDKVGKVLRERRSAAEARTEAFTKAIEMLVTVMQEILKDTSGDDANKLLAGTMKACESISSSIVEFRDEVASFRKMIGREDAGKYPDDGVLQPPSEQQDDINHATFRKILEGKSPEIAIQEAKDEAEKKTMLSAASMGATE